MFSFTELKGFYSEFQAFSYGSVCQRVCFCDQCITSDQWLQPLLTLLCGVVMFMLIFISITNAWNNIRNYQYKIFIVLINVHYKPLPAAVNAEGKHCYNDCLLWLVWMTCLFYASSCRDGCFPAFISSTQCTYSRSTLGTGTRKSGLRPT
jgi:hypothetical protein